MELIELKLLDTEKNYDSFLIKELVFRYNHNQSTSISLEDFQHILDTIDYILEHGETLEEGIQSIQSDIKEMQRIYKSIQILPFNNEKYQNVLKKQIPFFIQSVTGEDALFHYCDISVDLDYPLIDGIPLYHDMYHLRGTDLVLYYLKRLSEENYFCSLFNDLESFIEDYEKTIKTSVYDLQINFFELVVHQCITHISIYNSPGLIIHDKKEVNNVSVILDSLKYPIIDLFKENIIVSFDKIPIIYPQDSYQIAFSHKGADFYEILNQFEYSRDITLLRQLSIYDLIDFLEQDILTNEECTTFMGSLTTIEIVSILKLILPELDTFLQQTSLTEIIRELDSSITYQEVLSHFITAEVLHTYHQYIKKEGFCSMVLS